MQGVSPKVLHKNICNSLLLSIKKIIHIYFLYFLPFNWAYLLAYHIGRISYMNTRPAYHIYNRCDALMYMFQCTFCVASNMDQWTGSVFSTVHLHLPFLTCCIKKIGKYDRKSPWSAPIFVRLLSFNAASRGHQYCPICTCWLLLFCFYWI